MSDDLQDIFQQEARGYLTALNKGLLDLEMSAGDDRDDLLKELGRMVHSMKGAARAVGYEIVEMVSSHLEAIFDLAHDENMVITPGMGDTLYDALDLIQRQLDDDLPASDIQAEILANLEAIVSGDRHATDEIHKLQTDSSEIQVITDEILGIEDNSNLLADELAEKKQTNYVPPFVSGEQATPQGVSEELLGIFWQEVTEHVQTLNDGLVRVEMAREDERKELLREMNRVAHSMKGAARAVGYDTIETLSHYMEEFFDAVLDDRIVLKPAVADILYDALDIIQEIMTGEVIQNEELAAVLMQLTRLVEAKPKRRDVPLKGSDPVPPVEDTPEIEIPPMLLTSSIESVGVGAPTMIMRQPEESLRVSVSKLDQMMADASELLVVKMQSDARQRAVRNLQREHTKWQREWRKARSAYIRLARQVQEDPDSMTPEWLSIFRFLNANEDFLTRANRELTGLHQTVAQDTMHLATLTEQIQDNIASLRMMPFETIVGGFQRMARDVARDVNKQLHLDIRGVSVEIDKTVLDALSDPLMHVLRNAIDHGLESPQERLRRDKPPVGTISLAVEQRGSEISIEVKDDGRGLDVERIRRKAVDQAVITTQEARTLSEGDIKSLIFHSGLTTNNQVTALSGRGLGMDIVRTRIENLRGRVTVESEAGEGTTVTLTVPVSLTRLRVVTLRLGDERYAVPSTMIERMETIEKRAIFTAEGQDMLTLGGRPMPLLSLGAVLGTPQIEPRGDTLKVIVLQTADRQLAFEVDGLFTETEIVLKPLGRELRGAPFIAGAALLGSGEILLVLDVNDLVRRASGDIGATPTTVPQANTQRSQTAPETRPLRVLVVDDSITTRTLEKNILEAVGYDVHVAIDGMEAWQRIPEIKPDIVVSDVEMPNMNGLELTRTIRAHEATRDLPVILLTSLAKPEQRDAGLVAGANAYLVKSNFDQGDLLDTIDRLM
ncbi:MAG: hybrid sensor histidine kinase/response regulator [Chloroflexota bacterium]